VKFLITGAAFDAGNFGSVMLTHLSLAEKPDPETDTNDFAALGEGRV